MPDAAAVVSSGTRLFTLQQAGEHLCERSENTVEGEQRKDDGPYQILGPGALHGTPEGFYNTAAGF